jgi:glycyl-tRNA synthetase
LGLPKNKIHELEVPAADRAHYSKRTVDIEFDFPIGREELLGLAYRTDFDLMNIQNAAKKSLEYIEKGGGARFVPHVIEPSFGVERLVMAVLTTAYKKDGERVYLDFPKNLAPIKAVVSPLLKNKPELVAEAKKLYKVLKSELGNVMWDDSGNIGKRYAKADEIGVPYCIVVDFTTLEDAAVTVRDRNTTKQERIKIAKLLERIY